MTKIGLCNGNTVFISITQYEEKSLTLNNKENSNCFFDIFCNGPTILSRIKNFKCFCGISVFFLYLLELNIYVFYIHNFYNNNNIQVFWQALIK